MAREGRGCRDSAPGPGPRSGLGAESEAGAATRSLGINSIPWRGCGLFPVTRSPTGCPWSSCFLGAAEGRRLHRQRGLSCSEGCPGSAALLFRALSPRCTGRVWGAGEGELRSPQHPLSARCSRCARGTALFCPPPPLWVTGGWHFPLRCPRGAPEVPWDSSDVSPFLPPPDDSWCPQGAQNSSLCSCLWFLVRKARRAPGPAVWLGASPLPCPERCTPMVLSHPGKDEEQRRSKRSPLEKQRLPGGASGWEGRGPRGGSGSRRCGR